jgi:hypothetical protein
LFTTPAGQGLSQSLSEPQRKRIVKALAPLDPAARATVGRFLFGMINEAEQPKAARLARKELVR